jgi:hypothetical protein
VLFRLLAFSREQFLIMLLQLQLMKQLFSLLHGTALSGKAILTKQYRFLVTLLMMQPLVTLTIRPERLLSVFVLGDTTPAKQLLLLLALQNFQGSKLVMVLANHLTQIIAITLQMFMAGPRLRLGLG